MTPLETKISRNEYTTLKKEHDAIVKTIFNYYIDTRNCDILSFAKFLCEDVLPSDLFKKVVKARLKDRIKKQEGKELINRREPIKTKKVKLNISEEAFFLRQNIDSCKTLASCVASIEGNHIKSYGLKPKKTYNNLIRR